jgi:ubiquinone/menaquinone biosynthesis C-methylase UbiE
MKGVLDKGYARQREKRRAFKYRLRRRADEVVQAIRIFYPDPERILDLGTAEGRMLSRIKNSYPSTLCAGLEYSPELLDAGVALFQNISFVRADAQNMSYFKDASFDVIVAAAVIEHLKDPAEMLGESSRVLKPGGILIITTPHPFWEKLAGRLGMIQGEHESVMGFPTLRAHCLKAGFNVLKEKGFMISPIGFPGERHIERLLRRLKVDRHLANQLMVLKKAD